MAILKIKNFGVIGENPQDKEGFFSVKFSPVTVFIGKQASGKSTIAKLISIFSWLEKKLIRDGAPSTINMPVAVLENLCKQQEIKEYFHPDTKIIYDGDAYIYEYAKKDSVFTAKISSSFENYILPKIQYLTAARNLLTILYEFELPNTLDKKGNIIKAVKIKSIGTINKERSTRSNRNVIGETIRSGAISIKSAGSVNILTSLPSRIDSVLSVYAFNRKSNIGV